MVNEAYMVGVNRLPEMMAAIQNAGVPPRFTIDFLKSLGFKSTNDRNLISVLKGIGFLDSTGVPTEKYRAYKNKSEAKRVLGAALRISYEDLFLADENAQSATTEKISGIFGTKTGKGDAVTKKMATTFKALSALADFTSSSNPVEKEEKTDTEVNNNPPSSKKGSENSSPEFHYNIQIHLPATKDISVYNAIFKSLKDHLL